MNYDKVLDEIGEMGRWQAVALALLAILAASNGVDNTFNVFTGKVYYYLVPSDVAQLLQ